MVVVVWRLNTMEGSEAKLVRCFMEWLSFSCWSSVFVSVSMSDAIQILLILSNVVACMSPRLVLFYLVSHVLLF